MSDKESDSSAIKNRSFTYEDMLSAYLAGERHERQCRGNNDCWDFISYIKEAFFIGE